MGGGGGIALRKAGTAGREVVAARRTEKVKLRHGGHIKGEGNYQRVLMGLRVYQRVVK